MNIVFASSDSYAMTCGVSLLSLLFNNKEEEVLDIYVVDNGISKENKEKLLNTALEFNRKLSFLPKPDLEKLTGVSIYTGQWNIATFFRLFLDKLLPESCERVLYLDCDMIVRHSLHEIYNLDLGNCLCAGADDCRCNLYRKELGLSNESAYINNGFLLIDLKKWREYNPSQKFLDYIHHYNGDITYMDQGVLNAILSKKGLVKVIPPKYDAQRIFFDFSYDEILKLRKPENHCTKEEYEEAVTDPIVVHFTPTFITGTRPWEVGDNHKFTPEWLKYKGMSLWKDEPLREYHPVKKKKMIHDFVTRNNRSFVIKVASIAHSNVYPKIRMQKDKKNSKLVKKEDSKK